MKTWEMYKIALENPKAKFTRPNLNNAIYEFDEIGKLKLILGIESKLSDIPPKPDEDWELVREPVDFMTAARAFNDKVTIECHMLGLGEKKVYKPSELRMRAIFDQHGTAVTSEEILNGKWYIQD